MNVFWEFHWPFLTQSVFWLFLYSLSYLDTEFYLLIKYNWALISKLWTKSICCSVWFTVFVSVCFWALKCLILEQDNWILLGQFLTLKTPWKRFTQPLGLMCLGKKMAPYLLCYFLWNKFIFQWPVTMTCYPRASVNRVGVFIPNLQRGRGSGSVVKCMPNMHETWVELLTSPTKSKQVS